MEKINVCVTGANGFIGRNLLTHLRQIDDLDIRTITRETQVSEYRKILSGIDIVYHLAGVNRTLNQNEFRDGNEELTKTLLSGIKPGNKPVKFVLASSTQATLQNAYGMSKKAAEEAVETVTSKNIHGIIYRLPGVFGKWCKPGYNSVVATFCHNTAHNLPLTINNPDHPLTLVYIDDVVREFVGLLYEEVAGKRIINGSIPVEFNINVGRLADIISGFPGSRKTLKIPGLDDKLVKYLYSTYLSYLPHDAFSYPLEVRTDDRGFLFEWMKHESFGQIFISVTKPGIVRGNHFHHTKTEKFLVIQGSAEICFRNINDDNVIRYFVNGAAPQVLDIPPGYTHNITNTGDNELVTLFWANEIFDQTKPDTTSLKVV